MHDRKIYRIPRKVNEGFQLFGLGTRDMLMMIPPILFAIWVVVFSPFPVPAKIIITVFSVGGMYMALAQTLANGLRIIEYLKLLYRYWVVDQNIYTLNSNNKRTKEAPFRKLNYKKPAKQQREIIRSEWDNPDFDEPETEDKEEVLKELSAWIPKPKTLVSTNQAKDKGGESVNGD